MIKVVTVGDNCMDVYTKTNQAFPGGNPVNVAVYVQRLGHQSSYIGVIGNDDYGHMMLEKLKDKHIDISHISVLEGKTAITEVEIINNNRVLGDYDEGVFENFQLTQKDIDFIHTFDLMACGIWSKVEHDLHRISIPIAFDFADKWNSPVWEEVLPYIQFAFYSDDVHSLDEIKDFMKEKKVHDQQLIICTRGEHGSLVYDGQQFYSYGIIPCQVVDTIGAGDSYIAGFLCHYLEHHNILKAMKAGAQNSAQTIIYQGAW